jgi:hypothetical protein
MLNGGAGSDLLQGGLRVAAPPRGQTDVSTAVSVGAWGLGRHVSRHFRKHCACGSRQSAVFSNRADRAGNQHSGPAGPLGGAGAYLQLEYGRAYNCNWRRMVSRDVASQIFRHVASQPGLTAMELGLAVYGSALNPCGLPNSGRQRLDRAPQQQQCC